MTETARVRFRFTKIGKVRFTSHRDVARLWERALRRASLPVALTEGFNPRVKIHFGLALPTGYESLGEYVDVDFRAGDLERVEVAALPEALTLFLPEGMEVQAAARIDTAMPSLQQAVTSCAWRIEVAELGRRPCVGGAAPEAARRLPPNIDSSLSIRPQAPAAGLGSPPPMGELGRRPCVGGAAPEAAGALGDLRAAVERLLATESLPTVRQRKGRDVGDDIRPYIVELAVLDQPLRLEAELGTQPRGLRPSELLDAIRVELSGPRAMVGDEMIQEVIEQEVIEQEVIEQEVIEQEVIEQEVIEQDVIEEGLVCRTHQWVGSEGARHEPLAAPSPATHAKRRAS